MKTVRDMLREVDPVRHEGAREHRRAELRRIIVAATAPEGGSGRAASPWVSSGIGAVAVAVVIIAAAAAASRSWFGGSATLQAAVRFEVRLAETSPAPGLREAKVGDKVLYLHDEPVVANEDVSSASVISHQDDSAFDVEISFTAQGAEKMREATTAHTGQPMAILIDGQVVAAPVVKSTIGSRALITGHFTKAEAERIANGVTIRSR